VSEGTTYDGPGGWSAGGNFPSNPQGCGESPAGSSNPAYINCTGGATITQNFTNGSHRLDIAGGGTLALRFESSYSTIVVESAGGLSVSEMIVVGSHDNIFLNTSGGGTLTNLTIVGSYDNISLPTLGGMTANIFEVGDYDHITQASAGGATITLRVFGEDDVFSSASSGGETVAIHYTGFNPLAPTSSGCPYDNDSSSDKSYANASGGGTFTQTYNNTVYSGSGSVSGGSASWSTTWNKVTSLTTCPYYALAEAALGDSGAEPALLLVALHNTYSAGSVVALDEGAVVEAEVGAKPLMLTHPAITYNASSGTLSVWTPEFDDSVGTESGVGVAELSVRLDSVLNAELPLSVTGTTRVNITTPFASAWWSYFNSTSLASYVQCSPTTGSSASACDGPYAPNGPLGTVSLTVPATAIDLYVATYALVLS
jgi:hypothetical protein